jgi:centrosomal protein CEP76
MSILPFIEKSKLLSERSIYDHLNSEKKYETESSQDFIKYSSDWWDDYKTIRNSHTTRLVKIFVPTEDRENYIYKSCTSLIEPITIGRAINTPYEAARFVSLIPYERNETSGQKYEQWNTTHTFMSAGKGDVEDHSVLLCNLLLGFGLDAYIAVGVCINGPHVWVLTRNKLENKKYKITYWESLTGQRVNLEDSKIFRFYKKIHSVFNNNSFYANVQPDDSVFNTLYHFDDEYLWKNIPSDKLEALVKHNHTPFMDAILKDFYKLEMDLERDLKIKIQKHRKGLNYVFMYFSK